MLSDSEHKMSVVVLFGGMSSEHEVSRVSAGTFVDQLDRQRYELLTIGITKEGRWLYTEADSAQMADGSWEELPGNMPCVLSPDRADHGLILFTPAGQVEKVHVDVVIPVLHGLWGEDGTVQGLLELAGIPVRRLRRSGQRGLHGQGCGQRHVRRLRHPPHQVALRHPLGDRV